MVSRLIFSDARIIELVEIKMKKMAWDWFQRYVKEELYGENPPSWEKFKHMMMDEFLSSAER